MMILYLKRCISYYPVDFIDDANEIDNFIPWTEVKSIQDFLNR